MSVGNPPASYRATIGLATETTYGTAVAPTDFIDAISDDYEIDSGNNEQDTTRDRQTNKIEAGAVDVDGGWDAPANPEGGFGLILACALGADSVSDLTTGESYNHTITPADTLPSLTVRVDNDQTVIDYAGSWIESFELSHTSEDVLTYSVDAPPAEPIPGASSMSPTYSSLRNFQYHDATISVGGVAREADLSDLTISIANNGEKRWRDARTPGKASIGGLDVEAEVTLDFESTEAFESVLGSSGATSVEASLDPIAFDVSWASPATIGTSSDQYTLQCQMPQVYAMTHGATINQNDLVMEDVTLQPRVDQGGTISDMIQFDLDNSISGAYV